jgi:hypothetical protein
VAPVTEAFAALIERWIKSDWPHASSNQRTSDYTTSSVPPDRSTAWPPRVHEYNPTDVLASSDVHAAVIKRGRLHMAGAFADSPPLPTMCVLTSRDSAVVYIAGVRWC